MAGLYPSVFASAPPLHGNNARIQACSHPRQSTRHYHVAFCCAAGKYPKTDGAGTQAVGRIRLPYRCLRKADQFLGHIVFGIGAHLVDERCARSTRQVFAKNGKFPELWKTRLNDELVQPLDHLVQRSVFTAPPSGHGGHFERFAKQTLAQRWQEAKKRTRLQKA